MQNKLFYSVCFGFIFGVFLRSFIFVDIYLVILLGAISFALISKNQWGIISGIFILAFCIGIFRFNMVDAPAPSVFESHVGEKVSFSGIITDEPDIRENNQKLRSETQVDMAKTKILATVNLDEDFKYGDQINFSGKLQRPENFIADQGKNFDYVNYLRKDG